MDSDDEHGHNGAHHHHHPYTSIDGLGAAGGGSSTFNLFNTASHPSSLVSGTSLPAQPAPYEDFAFDGPFDPAQSYHNPMSSFFGFGHLYSPPNSFSSFAGSPPPPLSIPSAITPGQPISQSHPQQRNGNPGTRPANLFDDSESALFSSFLNTLDVDPNFLFNPVLPPGMPSPPPAIEPADVLQDRDRRLGQSVGGLSLGQVGQATGGHALESWHGQHRNGAQLQDSDDVDRKPDLGSANAILGHGQAHDDEELYEDEEDDDVEVDDTDADPDFFGGGTKRSAAVAGGRGGRRNRAAIGGQGGSTRGGKKARVAVPTPKTGSPILPEDENPFGNEDVDMKDAIFGGATSAAGTGRVRPSRATARRPSTGHRANTGAASVSKPSHQSRSSSGQSPDVDAEGDAELEDEPGDERDNGGTAAAGGSGSGATLTETQKRSNHIQSEQKRRNAIRNGFKDLVDILSAGEAASGIVVAPPDDAGADDGEGGGGPGNSSAGRKKKGKGTGRGRGRKGEVGAGASKSVVLDKAAQYILWLERGNDGLDSEVARVEDRLRELGIEV